MFPGFKPNNHPNQVKRRGADDSIDDRQTPDSVYLPLHEEFHFTLDAAASHDNAKCARYCTLGGTFEQVAGKEPRQIWAGDGIAYPWGEHVVWLNPPFSALLPWCEKAWDERQAPVVLLLPNNRGEQKFYQKLIEPYRDRPGSLLRTRKLPKRRPFLISGQEIGNRTSKNPPFGLEVVIWDRRRPEPAR
ncbi:MAG: hypothetical protein RL685_5169 [Pseudomonadota bacterium]